MARFEGALALASARAGVVPEEEARTIARVAASATFEAAELARAARLAGALAIPFVKAFTEQVRASSDSAARYVHFGATSQDVLDTATMLCVREAARRVKDLSEKTGDALSRLAAAHRATAMAGRTLLQPALPVPFGWKVASWLSMLARSHHAFATDSVACCVLQFGGAAGTLSAFRDRGTAVSEALARELGLCNPPISWHSARDRIARLGASAAILCGAAARVGRDVTLLMQPEVGEAVEPAATGRGGSSSLPHKRNPALSLLALEAAQRVPALAATLLVQLWPEHERGLGQWQSQWLTLRELLGATASALAAVSEIAEGLVVDASAMRTNLDRSLGLVYSEAASVRLSAALGKAAAHAKMEELSSVAASSKRNLLEVMRSDAVIGRHIDAAELEALFRPESTFGAAGEMLDGALVEWTRARSEAPAI